VNALPQSLTDLLATLTAIRWHSWVTHWKAQGGDSYSDHLLFQRIYSGEGGGPSINDQIDGLGERIIALFGNKSIDAAKLARKAAALAGTVSGLGRIAGALKLEEQALGEAARAADLSSSGTPAIRIGIDNFVRELADARSTVIYLLKQRLAGGDDAYGALGELDLVTPATGAALVGLLVVGPFVVTPFVLKAFVPRWSYGRRVAAGMGVSMGVGMATRLIRAAKEPAPQVYPAKPNNVYQLADHPDFGTPADEVLEADFAKKEKRRSKLLGWAFLGLMGYVAYWNYRQGPNPPWQHILWGPPDGVRR
jgi:hypothetical protein